MMMTVVVVKEEDRCWTWLSTIDHALVKLTWCTIHGRVGAFSDISLPETGMQSSKSLFFSPLPRAQCPLSRTIVG